MEVGHPALCKVSLSGLYSTESIKMQHNQLLEFDGFGDVRINTVLTWLLKMQDPKQALVQLWHLYMLSLKILQKISFS